MICYMYMFSLYIRKFKFRVGALEAEIAHPFSTNNEGASDVVSNQMAASAMLVENLREDINRLNTENQKLKGQFS